MSANRMIGIREQQEIEETIAVLSVWVVQLATTTQVILHPRVTEAANIACDGARATLRKLLDKPDATLNEMVMPLIERHARKADIANILIRHKDEVPNPKG